MPTAKSQQPSRSSAAPDAAASPDAVNSAWQRAREHLERCKARIVEQINSYPPPIPACDAQFNTLLEQRGDIAAELTRLEFARQQSIGQARGGQGDGGQAGQNPALAGFIAASEFIDEAAGREITAG